MTSDELATLVRAQLSTFTEEIRKELNTAVEKAAAPCGCVEKAAAIESDVEAVGEVLSTVLDRLENLEKATVRKHSLEGQEGEGIRRRATVGDAMLHSLRHPVNV